MITISVQLSEELAKRVLPVQDRLPEIIELGLERWRGQDPSHCARRWSGYERHRVS